MNSPSQQFSHTPKPWVLENHGVNDSEHGNGIVFIGGGAHRFVVIQNVGKLETVDMDVPKLEANARLMVASPDLLEFAQWAESRQPEMLKTIEANKFVFTDLGNEPGNWQHLAFTLYTELCALNEMARSVITKATKGAQ